MKNDVVKAARNLETDLMYGNPLKAEFVERRDIETLIAYVNKRIKKAENKTTELSVGDKVKINFDWADIPEGTTGKLTAIRDTEFKYGVMFLGRLSAVYFKREELEKVNQ